LLAPAGPRAGVAGSQRAGRPHDHAGRSLDRGVNGAERRAGDRYDPGMPTVIRTARPSDADPVANLIAQLGNSSEGTDGVGPRIAQLADTPSDAVLVAEVDGRVVGLVSLHVTPFFNRGTSRGRITALVVDES